VAAWEDELLAHRAADLERIRHRLIQGAGERYLDTQANDWVRYHDVVDGLEVSSSRWRLTTLPLGLRGKAFTKSTSQGTLNRASRFLR
jgi:hypothetical protein